MDFIIRNVYKKQDTSSTIMVIGTCNGRRVVIGYCHLVDSRMYDVPISSSSCLFGNLIYEEMVWCMRRLFLLYIKEIIRTELFQDPKI